MKLISVVEFTSLDSTKVLSNTRLGISKTTSKEL